MSKYYEFLHSITYENEKNVNGQGFVAVNQVPFLKSSDSVTFILTDRPDYLPEYHPIVQNKQKCAELAKTIRPEVERLKTSLDRQLEAARKKLDDLAAKRDAIPENSIYPSRELAQEEVVRQIGYCNALSDVWRLLSDRAYELYVCGRLK